MLGIAQKKSIMLIQLSDGGARVHCNLGYCFAAFCTKRGFGSSKNKMKRKVMIKNYILRRNVGDEKAMFFIIIIIQEMCCQT